MNTKIDTCVIYLTGKPGVGKYTVAKALSKHGFIICDNQLINNPIFELLQYDGFTKMPDFAWEAIGRIRDAVLNFLSIHTQNNYVLTNNLYEDEGDRQLYEQVKQMAFSRKSVLVPVRLLISEEEHLKRVTQPERRNRWKSIDPIDVYDQTPLLKIEDPNLLELDVTFLSPESAASQILRHIQQLVI